MPTGRPDYSEYVAHFTKDRIPNDARRLDSSHPSIIATSARDRLISILRTRCILATPMPWTARNAVAFTECPWGSLIDHTRRYSAYGFGFAKARVFAAGGGPAIYLRQDLLEKQQEYHHKSDTKQTGFHPHLWSFVTPFVPGYAPQSHLEKYWKREYPIDFSHEREWRVPMIFHLSFHRLSLLSYRAVQT